MHIVLDVEKYIRISKEHMFCACVCQDTGHGQADPEVQRQTLAGLPLETGEERLTGRNERI